MDTHSPLNPTPAVCELLDVVARLRGEQGCPWDRKQTLHSLRPCLVEECYELLEAMEAGDADAHCEELGDVLLQVALQSQIRAESGAFDFQAVAERLTRKLIRRHPHVFGTEAADSPEAAVLHWSESKRRERAANPGKAPQGALDGVPNRMPALHRAHRIQERAAQVGFDWDRGEDVLAKVDEELQEVREALASGSDSAVAEELGDLLFAVVNVCRFHGVHADDALREATAKFTKRFQSVETRFRERGRRMEDCPLSELDTEWNRVKEQCQ